MRAAVVRVLPVDEGEIGLAVGVAVGESELEAIVLAVGDLVERLRLAELGDEQILQPVLALEGLLGTTLRAVDELQATVEVGVVAEAMVR